MKFSSRGTVAGLQSRRLISHSRSIVRTGFKYLTHGLHSKVYDSDSIVTENCNKTPYQTWDKEEVL
jgi:hypothetical protein